ncbi:ubiquinone/menaquinone biosynthesis-related protein [Apiospora kogelbergensis]|uniref:Ubiquinone/menaquinone biosynthesis-related protein n=1 Tax=Apiospora kogelbergensis TaxID=1337665 RepID=A0AAW0QLX7_9PEZI
MASVYACRAFMARSMRRPASTPCMVARLPKAGSTTSPSPLQPRASWSRAASSSSSSGKKGGNHHKPLPYRAGSPTQQHPSSSPQATAAASESIFPKQPSTVTPEPVSQLFRTRWLGLFGAGAAALCLGTFTASFWIANRDEAPRYVTGCEPSVPTGRPAIESPVDFDRHLDKSEWRFGITKLRRRLAAEATGHVLEVAMGTGRNMEFYDWDAVTAEYVTAGERNRTKLAKRGWGTKGSIADLQEMESFTGVDISPAMLDIGLRRLRQVVPHGAMEDALPKQPNFEQLAAQSQAGSGVHLLRGKVRVVQGDAAQSPLPAPPRGVDKYDTVIQTFGLCSVRDPTRLIHNMAAAVKPETGRIILLEHGRSWWELVNGLLDRSAKGHFERFGCWWNRNIEDIVEVAQSQIPGLEVVEFQRPGWTTLGTHVWVELRVRDVKPTGGQDSGHDESRSGWLGSLGSSWLTVSAPENREKKG